MTLKQLQLQVKQLYKERDYRTSASTLMLGAVEEIGELAEAILLTQCEDFKPSPKKLLEPWAETCDVAHEVGDIITYLLALCNRLEIKPYFSWMESCEGDPFKQARSQVQPGNGRSQKWKI